jgi:hypothetical protein
MGFAIPAWKPAGAYITFAYNSDHVTMAHDKYRKSVLDTGDYRLLSCLAVDAVKQLWEQHRFMKGLFAWIGYPQKEVFYRRDLRYGGKTKRNYWKL